MPSQEALSSWMPVAVVAFLEYRKHMPIVHFYLSSGSFEKANVSRLLVEASALYAEVLNCPIDRIRAMAHTIDPSQFAVGGRLVSDGGVPAPYFEFLVLEGRPLEQRHRLLSGFTQKIMDVLGVEIDVVRGCCWAIPPEHWAIAGAPASQVRSSEIQSRTSPYVDFHPEVTQ